MLLKPGYFEKGDEKYYVDIYGISGKYRTKSIRFEPFTSKSKAIEYAKDYMKKH